jgi:hypothetical protein
MLVEVRIIEALRFRESDCLEVCENNFEELEEERKHNAILKTIGVCLWLRLVVGQQTHSHPRSGLGNGSSVFNFFQNRGVFFKFLMSLRL